MKVGYFTHTNISVSETFIYDLVKGLSLIDDVDLIYYSGKKKGVSAIDFSLKFICTGYSDRGENLSYKAFKLGQVIGKGYVFKSFVQRKIAFKYASKFVAELPDVAFIEYANSAVLLREFLEAKRIPYIVHVHGYDITSSLNDPVYHQELLKVIKGANYFIAASNYMKRLLILLGADENKIKVIRIGIDASLIKPLSWEERIKSDPSVVFLGRLTEKKHPIALLHAFKIVRNAIPNAKLTIIGDGPLKNEVVKRIELLGLSDAVKMLGSLSRDKSFPVMNRHWVYAQHSVTAKTGDQEGYALSPAEAATHELPVVSTIHNGIPEHVIDGITGYLVPEFNFELMAEKIIFLLKNPTIAKQMGVQGRLNIEKMNDSKIRINEIFLLMKTLSD